MNVLLTSATGYLGQAIAAALQSKGHRVTALARSAATVQRLEAAGIQPYRGDLMDTVALQQAAAQVDAVIHTAATNDAAMGLVDRQAVETLLTAIAGTHKPFLYTSGLWVMGNTGATVADETFPLNPPALVAWRPAVEALVLSAADRGVRSIVIRPALVYGRGGGLLSLLMQAGQSQGAVPVIGAGDNAWSFIHIDDLAALYVAALEQAPAGTLLIGASGESISMQQVALTIAKTLGRGHRLQHLTLEEARAIWGDLADALALDQRVSGDRAQRHLNWQPVAPWVFQELTQGSYAAKSIAA
ncbi:NAD-dependent epimerase/dehydratase family protein [Synechococcus elongatus]|uniref:NAD-dependent epimerase/dehydratase family protein n=1 Tax=Synechococcus elongatus PCC 11802 TaxID=2283154 RepID=A0AAT9JYN3_SYNEL|nr:NAD-dependent epimerase/dehydratase family protein [Synechococcus elongatus]QFZ91333.1 NAD-dependent epimerase/dehydratase family protein [Synechococcus elongatus PCC 11802]